LTEIKEVGVFDANITHNLAPMAREAGIYQHLWRPEELNIETASELIAPLREAIELLESDPDRFKELDAPNGWGTYENFVQFVRECLQACIDNPSASVYASR
jgi:hypothetical protein